MGCDAFILSLIILISVSIHAPTWGATAQMLNAQVNQAVSIHAPTWGATGGKKLGLTESEVSIHAPTWGATYIRRPLPPCAYRFNPRTHMGCDLHNLIWLTLVLIVSIHAPTWGATHNLIWLTLVLIVSIHAPTWGATVATEAEVEPTLSFNPRTHMGCDLQFANELKSYLSVSIHAPTWGAT